MKDMIKANKIHLCISDLLNSGEEEKLLCLCKLMQTVGKKLEEYELKKKRTTVAEYFDMISQISRDKKNTSSKIRFLFQDLIEMRRNNWTARRVEEKAKKQSAFRAAVDLPAGGAPTGAKFPTAGNNPRGFAAPKIAGSQDARAAPAAPAGEDDWSVASRKKGGRGGGASRAAAAPTPQGKGGFGDLQGSTVGNKFSLLGNAGAESASTGGRKVPKKVPHLQTSVSGSDTERGTRKKAEKLHRDDSGYSSGDNSATASSPKRNESDLSRSYSSAVGEDGSLDTHSVSRVVAAMNEFFLNDMLDEAVEVMRELVHPNAMHEALRACIQAILEKKAEDRVKFNAFLGGLYASGLLSGEQVILGLSNFLDSYDDIVIDVPRVCDYTAQIIANLYVAGALDDLSFMLSLPDENNFSMSMGQFDLIVKSACIVATLKDESVAKELLTATLQARGSLDDMQQEQLSSAVEKCSAQYLL
ncbi:EIF4G1 [Symbiodinium microadriaticum]|nr:EIF4G1 [Symbiodinium microadriaticum]